MPNGRYWTPDDIPDLAGHTALVTGAASGIGLVTAKQLARHGARVILAGRDQVGLDAAVSAIRAETPTAALDTLLVDLADLGSIRSAAPRIADRETIDLLINNAGVMNVPERRTTKDGFELTFGTNHLGHFALTALLMSAVRRSSAARIVTVSAIAATWPNARLTDLMSERRYRPMTAYAKSKRANVVFTEELTRRLAPEGIKAIVVHPGSAMTNLQRYTAGPLGSLVSTVAERLLMGSPEGAAWPTLYAATADGVRSGAFIGPAARRQDTGTPKEVPLPRGADDPVEGRELWAESERLTGIAFDVA